MGRTKQTKTVVDNKAPRKKKPVEAEKVQRPHRWRPGTVALRSVRHLQKDTACVLKRRPFQKLVKEIMSEYLTNPDASRVSKGAFALLQQGIEHSVIQELAKSIRVTTFDKRKTIMAKDLQLVRSFGVDTEATPELTPDFAVANEQEAQ